MAETPTFAAKPIAIPGRPARSGTSQAWLWTTVALTVGAFGLAIATSPAAGAAPAYGLGWLLFVGSSVHIAGTGWLFSFREVRAHAPERSARYVIVPLALVAVSGVMATLLSPRDLAIVLLGYFGWQFFHFQKQNLGITALAATALGLGPLTRLERWSILATGWAGIAALMLHPGTLQLSLHPRRGWYPAVPFHVVTVGFVASAAVGLVALLQRPARDRPAGYCAAYLLAVGFPLPIFVFASPYAAVGGMTIAHGLQYLVLVGMVTVGPRAGRRPVAQRIALLAAAVLGGLGLNRASHLHTGGSVAHLIYGGYLGVVMAHFVVDAGIWRLRDRFPRSFLSARLPSLLHPPPVSVPDASPAGVR
ncbi:MAG TPA: hypothetical protein VHW92_07620 [Mycobacteriales bacterium]|nr:hypothetical protein [Mycobacteriales bacterium]